MALTEQQHDAIKDLDKSVCVIAGAGTGKTRVLVERFMRLLDSGAALDELVAITFTEAAAAEMLERLRRECRNRADSSADGDAVRRWREHQWGLSSQHVSTIHSFCRRIISQYPIELGLDPQFGIISEAEGRRAMNAALVETMRTAAEEGNESLAALSQAYSVSTIKNLLRYVVTHRTHLLPHMELCDQPAEELAAKWLEQLQRQRAEALKKFTTDDDLLRAANLLETVQANDDDDKCELHRVQVVHLLKLIRGGETEDGWAALCELAAMNNRKVGRKAAWAAPQLLANVQAALALLRGAARQYIEPLNFADAETILDNLRLGQHVARLGREAIERFRQAKFSRGELDFDDLLLLTDELLRRSAHICRQVGGRYRQILVDELQDTDALQVSVLARLISCEGGTDGGGNFAPRPGSFFGVGDPKQSIYRFRGADVGVFREIIGNFGRQGTRMLSRTFRFHRGLATLVNRLFASVLGRDNFDELEAADQTVPPHSAELLITAADSETAPTVDDRTELEAAMVSRRILKLIEQGDATYGDIAILMRRHKTGFFFEEAFKRCGIPYAVIGGQRFYQQQEVRDAISALRVLRNPGNDLALATVLRSPYFGITDNSLYKLRTTGLPLRQALLSNDVLLSLDNEDAARADDCRRWLETFSRMAGRIGIARLMEQALFETGLIHSTLPQFLGLQRYANLRQLLEMAREHDRSGNPRLEDFLATVERVILEAVDESEAPLSEVGADCVRLMSIHKAKGLEFPHVFLVDCHYQQSGGGQGKPLYAAPDIGLAPLPPDRLKCRKPNGRTIFNAEVDRERSQEQDESRRLFYVATTRAQKRLYLCGVIGGRKADSSWLRWTLDGLGVTSDAGVDQPEGLEPGSRTIELRDTLGHLTNVLVDVSPAESLQKAESSTRAPSAVVKMLKNGKITDNCMSQVSTITATERVEALSRAIGPIISPAGLIRISATGLADYAKCPVLFYYRHVLRIADLSWQQYVFGKPADSADSLSGPLLGTLVHAVLAQSAAEEADVMLQAAERIVTQSPEAPESQKQGMLKAVTEMVDLYCKTSLPAELRAARQVFHELPFALKINRAIITGTIDLLYQTADGHWRLVDFKTDRLVPEEEAVNSGGYGIQMLVYRLAAEKFFSLKLENSCLLFLRAGKLIYSKPDCDQVHIETLTDRIIRQRFSVVSSCHADCGFSALCRDRSQAKSGRACNHASVT